MVYKYNFENATEKRIADKELGHVLMPDPDGQVKHPEHLQEHEMMVNIQRLALDGEVEKVRESLLQWPEGKRNDLRKILIDSVAEHGRTLDICKNHIHFQWKKYIILCVENVRIGGVMQLTWYIDMATI